MAEDLKRIKSLEGTWKFTVGDDPAWSGVAYNDSGWDYVKVPNSWESNGFIGYNGYAWYRKTFNLNSEISGDYVFLLMGTIDDVDEVYVNGQLIGYSGVFPVLMRTAYNVPRKYPIPVELLNKNGDNLIAVRVYDEYLDGGIINGPVGLYYDQETSYLSQDLSGYWEFETAKGNRNEGKSIYYKKQDEIFVPGFWESLGYSEYDGHAIYTKRFTLSKRVDSDSKLYLILGYIDDKDEVFLNDKKIGDVEDINRGSRNYYRVFRGYEIPSGTLNENGTNTLVVKVYDSGELGGIYEGPVGIATGENYKKLKRKREESSDTYWHDFFKTLFD